MKLDHINLSVPSMKEALDFYVNKLGFKIIGDFGNGKKFVYIQNEEITYELFEEDVLDITVSHIAYTSTDIKKDYENLKNKNVKLLTTLNYIDFLWENGVYYFLFEGANKEIIEYCQKK